MASTYINHVRLLYVLMEFDLVFANFSTSKPRKRPAAAIDMAGHRISLLLLGKKIEQKHYGAGLNDVSPNETSQQQLAAGDSRRHISQKPCRKF